MGKRKSVRNCLRSAVGLDRTDWDLEQVSEDEISAMKGATLKEILSALGLPKSGSGHELRARVLEAKRASATNVQVGATKSVVLESAVVSNVPSIAPKQSDSTSLAATKKKKKWAVTDPLEIPPNCYHKDVFQACFPLVEIVEVPKGREFPVAVNKFSEPVLDTEVTREARRMWTRRFLSVSDAYSEPLNENQAFPLHFSFLEPLKKFTRLSQAEFTKHVRVCGKRSRDHGTSGMPSKRGKVDVEDNASLSIQMTVDPVNELNESGSNNAGMEITPEGSAEMTGDLREEANVATGFADGLIHVCDERAFERVKKMVATEEKSVEELSSMDPDRIVAVLERKFVEDKHKFNARYQGGFYAAKHLLVNLKNGHGLPVYVLVMTSHTWSYGILVAEGYVTVGSDGRVTKESMKLFKEHQAVTGKCWHSFDNLQSMLAKGTEFYRRCYAEKPDAIYPRGVMLVGKFYLCSEWYRLPSVTHSGTVADDSLRLFDGLMRLVLGDVVLGLTAEDLAERRRVRKQMLDEKEKVCMPY
ncbi:uncharacterized protein LOC9646846 [Selaginella moellendorffii]|uniref:uncharacterized protein LOC9646846 n=1 Tax=Selaginella moellendorffii TaxID=88036 RepID=UPI000D1D0CB6|nr:uncharacterized protein LOC9646846 [Selaginella moellendorffii]|eukprot:XP_024540903.1 uncharacterized protein LOC9646846 [Selaginella moellendorffii]